MSMVVFSDNIIIYIYHHIAFFLLNKSIGLHNLFTV